MPTKLTEAVRWLKTNLPSLEAAALESERIDGLRTESKAMQDEIQRLTITRDQHRNDVEGIQASLAASTAKTKESFAKAEQVAVARLEDLQRQQQPLEDQLVLIRRKIAEQAKIYDKLEAEHQAKVDKLQRDVVKAQAKLAEIQASIQALHRHLATAP